MIFRMFLCLRDIKVIFDAQGQQNQGFSFYFVEKNVKGRNGLPSSPIILMSLYLLLFFHFFVHFFGFHPLFGYTVCFLLLLFQRCFLKEKKE